MKALDNALSDNVTGHCINTIKRLRALISMTKEATCPTTLASSTSIPAGHAAQGISRPCSKRRSRRAFVYSYQEQAESLFRNYLDSCRGNNVTRLRDAIRNTNEELSPDEKASESIGGADRDHRIGRSTASARK